MSEESTNDDKPVREPRRDEGRYLGFFQDSELFVVLLGAIFGLALSVALSSLLFKSSAVVAVAGAYGAYIGGIRVPVRIYGRRRLKAGLLLQVEELTTELDRVLKGQLPEALAGVTWVAFSVVFIRAWKVQDVQKLHEVGVMLVALPVLAVVYRIVRRRAIHNDRATAEATPTLPTESPAPADLEDIKNRTELRHMTVIVFLFAVTNTAVAIGSVVKEVSAQPITIERSLWNALLIPLTLVPSAIAVMGGRAMVKRQDWKRAMWGPKAIIGTLWPLFLFSQVFGYVAYSKLRQPGVKKLFASEGSAHPAGSLKRSDPVGVPDV